MAQAGGARTVVVQGHEGGISVATALAWGSVGVDFDSVVAGWQRAFAAARSALQAAKGSLSEPELDSRERALAHEIEATAVALRRLRSSPRADRVLSADAAPTARGDTRTVQ
jgi:hypothetical protein